MTGKPNPEHEDPVDLAAIKDAEERMGYFKLKSAHDYSVPDHLRMNIDKAKWRLLVIREKVAVFVLLQKRRFVCFNIKDHGCLALTFVIYCHVYYWLLLLSISG